MRPTTEPADAHTPPPREAVLSVRQLAHELNSLVDGALRCLTLADRRLAPVSMDPRASANLQLARQALERMTELLESAMAADPPGVRTLASRQILRDGVHRIMAIMAPLAEERGVELRWSIDDSIGGLPCSLLEVVLINALRNAVEAAAAMPAGERRVDLTVAGGGGGFVELSVADSGPGIETEPAGGPTMSVGHGIGLELCRQVIAELGGQLTVATAPYRGGTTLHAKVPIAILRAVLS